jgi:hypothetical protein
MVLQQQYDVACIVQESSTDLFVLHMHLACLLSIVRYFLTATAAKATANATAAPKAAARG